MAKKKAARKKTSKAPSPVAEEIDGAVLVTFPERILRARPAPPPKRRPRHCPSCDYGPVAHKERYGTTLTAYLFRCPRCVDPDTCLPTKWQDPRG